MLRTGNRKLIPACYRKQIIIALNVSGNCSTDVGDCEYCAYDQNRCCRKRETQATLARCQSDYCVHTRSDALPGYKRWNNHPNYKYRSVPKFSPYGSVCCACANVTKNIRYFSMGPKLRHPTVQSQWQTCGVAEAPGPDSRSASASRTHCVYCWTTACKPRLNSKSNPVKHVFIRVDRKQPLVEKSTVCKKSMKSNFCSECGLAASRVRHSVTI